MTNEFALDEKELLKVFLDETLFPPEQSFSYLSNHNSQLRNNSYSPPTMGNNFRIELIVRPECNQHCDYCYITQYGSELYPLEERVDNKTILNNLDIILSYVLNERKIYINDWELFAGDIFYDDLAWNIFDIFYNHLSQIHNIYSKLMAEKPCCIVIPSNCSFVQNDEKVQKFEEYFKKFEEIDTHLILSYSGDGKYATSFREHMDLSDDYYDKLFTFLGQHHTYCVHPMLSAENVQYWKENLDWWI